jgi:hypothetical protein
MSDTREQATTDGDLVKNAVEQAGKHGGYRGRKLWDIVSWMFDCRPSEARALCHRYGRDPDEVPQP